MAQFTYSQTQTMEPRPGQKFSTTYYQQSARDYQLVKTHVQAVAEAILAVAERDPDVSLWLTLPLKGFPRTGAKPNYSTEDILTDMLTQLTSGKDIPSGILGRWNRLFADTAWDILLELPQPENSYKLLFAE